MGAARVALRVVAIRSRRGASRPKARGPGTTRRRTDLSSAAGTSVSSGKTETTLGTLSLEGAVRRRLSSQEGGGYAQVRSQPGDPDMVASIDDFSTVRRAHFWCLQWPQVHPGAGHREYDRSQARRVRADPDILRPRWRQAGEEGLRWANQRRLAASMRPKPRLAFAGCAPALASSTSSPRRSAAEPPRRHWQS